jgi:hypothetical protein
MTVQAITPEYSAGRAWAPLEGRCSIQLSYGRTMKSLVFLDCPIFCAHPAVPGFGPFAASVAARSIDHVPWFCTLTLAHLIREMDEQTREMR